MASKTTTFKPRNARQNTQLRFPGTSLEIQLTVTAIDGNLNNTSNPEATFPMLADFIKDIRKDVLSKVSINNEKKYVLEVVSPREMRVVEIAKMENGGWANNEGKSVYTLDSASCRHVRNAVLKVADNFFGLFFNLFKTDDANQVNLEETHCCYADTSSFIAKAMHHKISNLRDVLDFYVSCGWQAYFDVIASITLCGSYSVGSVFGATHLVYVNTNDGLLKNNKSLLLSAVQHGNGRFDYFTRNGLIIKLNSSLFLVAPGRTPQNNSSAVVMSKVQMVNDVKSECSEICDTEETPSTSTPQKVVPTSSLTAISKGVTQLRPLNKTPISPVDKAQNDYNHNHANRFATYEGSIEIGKYTERVLSIMHDKNFIDAYNKGKTYEEIFFVTLEEFKTEPYNEVCSTANSLVRVPHITKLISFLTKSETFAAEDELLKATLPMFMLLVDLEPLQDGGIPSETLLTCGDGDQSPFVDRLAMAFESKYVRPYADVEEN